MISACRAGQMPGAAQIGTCGTRKPMARGSRTPSKDGSLFMFLR